MKTPSLFEVQHWIMSRIQEKKTDFQSVVPESDRNVIPESFYRGSNPMDSRQKLCGNDREATYGDDQEAICENDKLEVESFLIPGQERLAVYAEGYRVRFRDGVSEVYEAIRWILGESQFAELVKNYSLKYPSRDTNLSFVGKYLPEFISTLPLAKQLPFIMDLAKLEWQLCGAFHAFDKIPVSPDELSKLSPEALTQGRFIFQASLFTITSDWPILDIWKSRKKSREEVNLNLEGRPQCIMGYRCGVKIECCLLENWQFQTLEGLKAGLNLEMVCEKLADDLSEELPLVAAWFSSLISKGLITRIR